MFTLADDLRGPDGRVLRPRGFREDGRPDPTGVVKGWAVDEALARLRLAGARNVQVAAGGDLVAAGGPEAGRAWRIGIRHPEDVASVAAVLEVRDLAVATSGLYERGGHIRDPHTGRVAHGPPIDDGRRPDARARRCLRDRGVRDGGGRDGVGRGATGLRRAGDHGTGSRHVDPARRRACCATTTTDVLSAPSQARGGSLGAIDQPRASLGAIPMTTPFTPAEPEQDPYRPVFESPTQPVPRPHPWPPWCRRPLRATRRRRRTASQPSPRTRPPHQTAAEAATALGAEWARSSWRRP